MFSDKISKTSQDLDATLPFSWCKFGRPFFHNSLNLYCIQTCSNGEKLSQTWRTNNILKAGRIRLQYNNGTYFALINSHYLYIKTQHSYRKIDCTRHVHWYVSFASHISVAYSLTITWPEVFESAMHVLTRIRVCVLCCITRSWIAGPRSPRTAEKTRTRFDTSIDPCAAGRNRLAPANISLEKSWRR